MDKNEWKYYTKEQKKEIFVETSISDCNVLYILSEIITRGAPWHTNYAPVPNPAQIHYLQQWPNEHVDSWAGWKRVEYSATDSKTRRMFGR